MNGPEWAWAFLLTWSAGFLLLWAVVWIRRNGWAWLCRLGFHKRSGFVLVHLDSERRRFRQFCRRCGKDTR